MSRLAFDQQVRVTAHLVDGCSIRTTERLCAVHRDTVMRWGLCLGEACRRLHDALMVGLQVDLLQVDEIWAFLFKKQKRLGPNDPSEWGDEWTFIGLDAIRKAIVAFRVGKRTAATASAFALDLRERIVNRPHISSDGFPSYPEAIAQAFAERADYGMVIKRYGGSPSRYLGSDKSAIAGEPRFADISTSMVERENLTMRMGLRRFTRKTNGFSKKLRNHAAAVALYVAHYNFCRIHETLRTAPAVAIGVAERVWSIGELIEAAFSIAPTAEPDTDQMSTLRTLSAPRTLLLGS